MLTALLALAVALTPPQVTVAVAGDSVIVTVAVADNAAAQPSSVDSVGVYIEITGLGASSIRTATEAHVAGGTMHRFAYPLSLWTPGQTRSGIVGARLGHTDGTAAVWSEWVYTTAPTWSYTRGAVAPNPPEAGTVSAATATLN